MVRRWWQWLLQRPLRRLAPAIASLLAASLIAALLLTSGSPSRRHLATATSSTAAGTTSTAASSTASSTTTTAAPTTTSHAAATVGPTSSSAPAAASYAWPQFGQGSSRTGVAQAGPSAAGAHVRWRTGLDGAVYSEPLAGNGLVIAATENDTVYALRQADGSIAWQQHLGSPVAGSSLPCGDIDPSGITGTPALDPATGSVYVVVFVVPQRHDLVSLDLTTGHVRWRRTIDPPGLSATVEQQRAALTVANGKVYVPFGGLYGDCGNYRGAVVASRLDGTGPTQAWVAPAQREAGIWAPGGAAVDTGGNLFVSTGNGSSTNPAAYDGGNSVFRLTPDLGQADSFAPADWAALAASDTDLGSTAPLLVGNGQVFIAGKDGNGYLLSAQHLGGIGGQQFAGTACPGGAAFGGSAWSDPLVIVDCDTGPSAVRVDRPGHFAAAWTASGGLGGAPSIAAATVWVVQRRGHVLGLDLASGAVRADVNLGGTVPGFPSPAVLPDLVVVPAGHAVAAVGD